MSPKANEIKEEILRLTREFSRLSHRANLPGYGKAVARRTFTPGVDTVPYAGRVFTEEEVCAGVSSALDFWLTLGKEGDSFEKGLAEYLGIRKSILCNSGSSANLLAVSALTSPKLGERRLVHGDEVITVAAGFPTTVAPIIQNGLVPVFIDNSPITGNAVVDQLEEAYSPGKTKAIMMAHTLGNPFDLSRVVNFCKKYNLWLIEDNCDALGSEYDGAFTGTFGDLSTQSFYPPHHITLGEGGAVNVVAKPLLKTIVESFRDWGRDCWCASGVDNTCGKRFDWQLGELPDGYDHKFTYSHFGYNLKPLDIQAAIGVEQLRKLPDFCKARIKNWEVLRKNLDDLGEYFDFMLPTHSTKWTSSGFEWDSTGHETKCSWFGFMLRVRPGAPFSRSALARYLDEKKIGNRMLFGGNLLRQPAFVQLRKDRPSSFRIRGEPATVNERLTSERITALLPGADELMNASIFLGTYPGLSDEQLTFVIDTIHDFVGNC